MRGVQTNRGGVCQMTHQNIIDLRELICTVEQLTFEKTKLLDIFQQRINPLNNTHHAVPANVVEVINTIATAHNGAVIKLQQMCHAVEQLAVQVCSPDTNIKAFALYEELTRWHINYNSNVADKLNGLSLDTN